MGTKQTYEQKLQAQLDQWGADIDKLKAKADKAKADTKLEYNEQIEKLRAKREAANKKFEELKNASDDAWEELKTGVESMKDSFHKTLKAVSSRFH